MTPVKLSTRKKYLNLSIAAVLGHVGLCAPAIVFAESPANSKSSVITVVGEKINKNINDTSSAVSVISADEFENGRETSANDLATRIPNVVSGGFGAISIRGISGTGAALGGYAFYSGSRARISTIVDGVTQSWSGYSFTPSKLWDVSQVEVLRGPQSTTQGTNAIGGALVLSTNDPTYTWESALRMGMEHYKNDNVKNNLALMVSGPLIDDELAFRLALDGRKGEGWMNYKQTATELDNGPDVDDAKNINARMKFLWEPSALPDLKAKLTLTRQVYKGEYLNWANDSETGYTSHTMTLSLADRENIRLQDSDVASVATDIDYALTQGLTNAFHFSYLVTDVEFEQYPNSMVVTSDKDHMVFENRLLYQSDDAAFSGVAGLFWSREKTDLQIGSSFGGPNEVTTSALYGEGTYAVLPELKLIGGMRFENEKIDRSLAFSWRDDDYAQDTSKDIFLPKAGIVYDLTDNMVASASVRKGYNAGSASVNWDTFAYYDYDEETVIAYEAGLKTSFDDADLNVSLFYNDYSGYQAFVQSAYIDNIEDSHTYGVELEGSLWATDSLQLRSSIGLMRSKVDHDDVSMAGNELPNAPHSNLSAGFTHYVSDNFSFGSDVVYVGSAYSDLENTADLKVDDYVTVNAQIQYIWGDLTIDGYVTNLTDEDIIYMKQSTRASVGQTQTIGLNLTYRM
ncbi:Pesticin receptor precursor [Vibrio aerogenes CECT 7868]|uniref:Pesticin receptor n=1 Tax=Vibrio aerogenes CECT 7868 TaxID=1216006 RepID=A0A1M5XD20_9VIBR|nr:TonB-dependent receptor [Vibrio aerogenes]SHH97404.1 Pesticin receptor precursor [Vibrio aerogenes CECT 7868]